MNGLGKLLVFHFLLCLGQIVHGFKIIHGKEVPKNSMQYMVSIQDKYGFHLCGGFLIREEFVVTAAHCDELESPIHQIFLGSHNLRKNGILKTFDYKCKPPTYENLGLGDDIMLLKLSERVDQNDRIKTVPLPTSVVNLKESEQCSVAGWGKISTLSSTINDLRVVNVSIIEPEVCKEEWLNLPSKVICAGGYKTNKGFCQGDSGGPLVCRGKPVGVVSFNNRGICNYPNRPNVYTDLSKFLPWINKILSANKCET
ncbi:trypsin-3 isoform X2 [Austrofundulus limnaeus]|uniref:Trypsin-3 isoform X2 n=1 Tax=Austrofundulus limnaeus TaxID=52670 RepID=A0A2I4BQG3_AUSLI|nr:PREDICTED: trypsin-3-like isoform X2 [Austrofundulus limnaeus]